MQLDKPSMQLDEPEGSALPSRTPAKAITHKESILRMKSLPVLVILAATLLTPGAGSAEDLKKVRVVIIDGQNNHKWRVTTPYLKRILEKSGRFTVDVSSNLKKGDKPGVVKPTVTFPPDLKNYDVVLSNYNGAAWPAEFKKTFESRLHEGKIGFVLFHAANNCFADWPAFNLMVGMAWRGNKAGDRIYYDDKGKLVRVPKGQGSGTSETYHPYAVNLRSADHPIVKGMPKQWLHARDQLMFSLRGPIKDVTVLASSPCPKTKVDEPILWTVAYGKGRVVHTPMGHDTAAMSCTGFITTMQRSTEWAATGKVSIPIPKDFPTEKEVRLNK